MPRSPSFLIAGVLLLAGCREDAVQTYQVPKEVKTTGVPTGQMELPPGHPPIGEEMAPEAPHAELAWKIPAGWKEQPPSSMRVGSFLFRADNDQSADISVVPLSGEAGGLLANVNRWRGQINLGPVTEEELAKSAQKIQPSGREMILVDFANQGKRVTAAVHTRGERTWFFKMMGEETAVGQAKPSFLQFLKSLKFHDH